MTDFPSPPSDHAHRLRQLLDLSIPVAAARASLGGDGSDVDPVVEMSRAHVLSVLQRFVSGDLSAEEAVAWAESVHLRDDVGLPSGDSDLLNDVLIEMSNPDLFGTLGETSGLLISRLEAR